MGESESSGVGSMLKAREKNMLEDLKLQREMTALDVERRHLDKVMYNDMFEQRRLAYKLKQEVADIKKRTETELKRRVTSRALLRAKLTGSQTDSAVFTTCMDAAGERTRLHSDSSQPRDIHSRPMFPAITTGNSRRPSMLHSRLSQSMPTLPSIRDEDAPSNTARDLHGPDTGLEAAPPKAKVRFMNLIKKVVEERADSMAQDDQGAEEGRSKKTTWPSLLDRLLPKYPPARMTSVTMPEGESQEDQALLPGDGEAVMVLTDFWVGDPKAINSVRRPCKPPDDMNNREKSIGEVRTPLHGTGTVRLSRVQR